LHPELQLTVDGARKCEPWERVVADGARGDHIVQLYQDLASLNCAVCRFVGAGLEDQVLGWALFRERISQLLHDPRTGRTSDGVEVRET